MNKTQRSTKTRPPVVQAQEDGEARLDTGDLTMGVILLLVIPTVAYIALGAMGMPVGGNPGVDFETGFENQEKRKALKKQDAVAMTDEEYQMRYQRTRRLLSERISDYRERVKISTDNMEKGLWVDLGRAAVSEARSHFESLLTSLEHTDALGNREKNELRSQIARCDEQMAWLEQHDPFSAVRKMNSKRKKN